MNKVYKITNLKNGKVYIGKTNKSGKKFDWYWGSGIKINIIIEVCGKENFFKEVLFESDDKNKINEMEIYFIKKFKSKNKKYGYNISNGGDGGCGVITSEHAEKISKANKGKIPWNKGKTFIHSKEHAEKISKANKKRGMTKECKNRLSRRMKENNPIFKTDMERDGSGRWKSKGKV